MATLKLGAEVIGYRKIKDGAFTLCKMLVELDSGREYVEQFFPEGVTQPKPGPCVAEFELSTYENRLSLRLRNLVSKA